MGEYRHYLAFRKMSEAYASAYQAGDGAAIERMIDFYGGAGTFAGWPQRVRDYASQTTPVNLLDWSSAYGFDLTPGLLATIRIPTLVFWGETSHPAAKRANQLLGQCIPNADAATIAGAAHFMIATHAGEVAGMIAQHVARAEQGAVAPAELNDEPVWINCSHPRTATGVHPLPPRALRVAGRGRVASANSLAEDAPIDPHPGPRRYAGRGEGGRYSATASPEPPSSFGKSFSFGRPSRIGSTVSA